MKTLNQMYSGHTGKVTDKWQLYLSEYERVFKEYRAGPIRLLEIGIQNGGSLEIWSSYFPQAEHLVGCDIDPNCINLKYEDSRISVIVGDANTSETEKRILINSNFFDIIVDDGSHTSSDIIKTFTRYFPLLESGGVFVIEDLHCSYLQEFGGGLHDPLSSMAFFFQLANTLNYESWGIDKKRKDLFNGFIEKYDVVLTEDILQSIHSVEFLNSMCFIKKMDKASNNLGPRVVVGRTEAVIQDTLKRNGSFIHIPSQVYNKWSNTIPMEELIQLRREIDIAKHEIEVLNAENIKKSKLITSIEDSNSWRLTKPLRKIRELFVK